MVSQCVNPSCESKFWLLNTGDLYALERRSADTEFFWLCSACSKKLALALDSRGRVTVLPRAQALHPQPPRPDADLRLIARPLLSKPWLQDRHFSDLSRTPAYMRSGSVHSSEAA